MTSSGARARSDRPSFRVAACATSSSSFSCSPSAPARPAPAHPLATALGVAVAATASLALTAQASEEYAIDPAHSFIEFKIQHLGYSWLHGRFNDFSGSFTVDASSWSAASVPSKSRKRACR